MAPFERDPHLIPPNFVKVYFFFIFAYPENFMCLAWVVKKFQFWRPRLRGIPPTWHPGFSFTPILPDIFNRSNFEYSAFSGLEVDSGRRKRKKKK